MREVGEARRKSDLETSGAAGVAGGESLDLRKLTASSCEALEGCRRAL
jgi:hypothetical protein